MNRGVRIGLGLLPAIAGGLLGFAGFAAERYDERLYTTALSLLRNEKPDQALQTFRELTESFPDSPLADDALYMSGRYHYRPQEIGELHRVDRASLEAARPFFRDIRERYGRTDSAPLALYKLGLIALEAHNAERDLDEAFANFSRVMNLYPASPVVDRALLGAAHTLYHLKSFSRALLHLERLLDRFPDSPTIPRALFLQAECQARQGQVVAAMESLQELIDREDDPSWRTRALQRSTLLYRTRFLSTVGEEVGYLPDRDFERATARAGMRSCADLGVDEDGRVYAADSRQGLLWSFRRDGGLLGNLQRPDGIHWLAVRRGRGVLSGNRDTIFLGRRARTLGTEEDPIKEIKSAAIAEEGELFLLDRKTREIVELGPALDIRSRRSLPDGGKPMGIRIGPLGEVLLMMGSDPRVFSLSSTRGWKEEISGEERLGSRPEDFAVDDLSNLYVLSDRGEEVRILGPDGEAIALLEVEPYADGSRFLPDRVAIDGAGAIYLCHRKGSRIVRYR